MADVKDKQVSPLSAEAEIDAAAWLYSEEGGKLGGKPFIVGQAKRKVYGLIPALVSRSGFFKALTSDMKSLEAISEQAPFALLTDDRHFTDGIPKSFTIVWNYINGIAPEYTRAEPTQEEIGNYKRSKIIWQPGMTLEDKYMVIFYADWFDVPINLNERFVTTYVDLLVPDLIAEMKTRMRPELVKMAEGLRNVIIRTEQFYGGNNFVDLSDVMPLERRYDMIYGKRSPEIPANYHEIFPSGDLSAMYNQLKEAKGLVAEIADSGQWTILIRGIRQVIERGGLTPDQVTLLSNFKRVMPIEKVELLPVDEVLKLPVSDADKLILPHRSPQWIVLTSGPTKLITLGWHVTAGDVTYPLSLILLGVGQILDDRGYSTGAEFRFYVP